MDNLSRHFGWLCAPQEVHKKSLSLCFSFGFNRNDAAVAVATMEAHRAVNEGEQRVVAAHADVLARVMHSAALANDDVACHTCLAAKDLHAQAFGC